MDLKKLGKKVLKVLGILLIVLIVASITGPFLFWPVVFAYWAFSNLLKRRKEWAERKKANKTT